MPTLKTTNVFESGLVRCVELKYFFVGLHCRLIDNVEEGSWHWSTRRSEKGWLTGSGFTWAKWAKNSEFPSFSSRNSLYDSQQQFCKTVPGIIKSAWKLKKSREGWMEGWMEGWKHGASFPTWLSSAAGHTISRYPRLSCMLVYLCLSGKGRPLWGFVSHRRHKYVVWNTIPTLVVPWGLSYSNLQHNMNDDDLVGASWKLRHSIQPRPLMGRTRKKSGAIALSGVHISLGSTWYSFVNDISTIWLVARALWKFQHIIQPRPLMRSSCFWPVSTSLVSTWYSLDVGL